jgi:signal transduction histidine kinase
MTRPVAGRRPRAAGRSTSSRASDGLPPTEQPHEPSSDGYGQRARVPSDAGLRFLDVAARRVRGRREDARTLLDSILRDARDLLGASRAAIMLYDAEDQTVEILDIGKPVFPGRIVHIGEGVSGRVIVSGRPLVVEDYENWPGKISGEVEGPPIVSAIAVPLHSGTTPIGALTVHSTDPARRFTMTDAHILELFADIAMLALSHVSLYDEVRALNRRLERRVRERTRALERSTDEIARKKEQLEELLAGIGHTQNEERGRIAQDIHDGVMQTLTGAIYELKALETLDASDHHAPGIRTVRELLHQLETELRGVIQDLRPAALEGAGLAAAIEAEANELRSRFGINCLVKVSGRRRPLPEPVEIAALRIVKEALRNAHLHAAAEAVGIEVQYRRRDVQIVVRDDGCGFDPVRTNDLRPHLGITGMRRRAEAIGGTFALHSKPGNGTTIEASLPVAVTR